MAGDHVFEAKMWGAWKVLVPVPGTPGLWMPCDQSVRATCPDCNAQPFEPCRTERGSVVLSGSMLETIRLLSDHERVQEAPLQKLRKRLQGFSPVRSAPHEARKIRYQQNPELKRIFKRVGRRPKLSASAVAELAAMCRWEIEREKRDVAEAAE